MYNFNNFIADVNGDNGTILINLSNSSYVTLTAEEASELNSFMNSEIVSPKNDIIKYLIQNKWIVYSNFRFSMDQPHSHDYQLYDGMISNFELQTAIVEFSTTCSLNCSFCDANSSKVNISCFCKRWSYEPQNYDYNELIKQLNDFKIKNIYIMGGDPFSNEYDFNKMMCFITQVDEINTNIKIGIMVNGYSIKKEQLDILKGASNIYFNIMFVGCNDEDYTRITGTENAFTTIISNIEMIKEFKFPVIGTLLINSLEKLNLSLEIDIPVTNKYLFDENCNDINLLKDYRERLINIDFITYQYTKRTNSCLYGKVFIASNQKVYPCPSLRDFELGNLQSESLSEIFRRGEYIEFWFLAKEKITPCKHCKYRLQCFDCRALEYSKSGDINFEYYCEEAELIMSKG